jgi:NitT/TauT family transport system permease protein
MANDNPAAAVKPAGPIAIPGALLLRYAPLVILALAWEAASRFHLVSALALPPPGDVAAAWVELARSGELAGNAADSLYRAGAGLALAVAVGGALGIGMATWRPLDLVLGPRSSSSIRCRNRH